MYVYDKEVFGRIRSRERREKRELKNEATPTMLLKTHVEKMSVLATPTISMKTSDLSGYSHDIHENKGSYAPGSTAPNPDFSPGLGTVGRSTAIILPPGDVPPPAQRQQFVRRGLARFGVRELAPAFSTADSSAVGSPRRVAASKSGDESPHSKNAASDRRGEKCGLRPLRARRWGSE